MAKARTARSCPVAAFQKMISGKYKLRIVWDLKDGPRRYGEIRSGLLRGMAGSAEITPRVLSRELKALSASGRSSRRSANGASAISARRRRQRSQPNRA
jgi:DNA-binding HxlR family transcriptional regulator